MFGIVQRITLPQLIALALSLIAIVISLYGAYWARRRRIAFMALMEQAMRDEHEDQIARLGPSYSGPEWEERVQRLQREQQEESER